MTLRPKKRQFMTNYTKKYIHKIRLNSFHPLCETEIGQNAIREFSFPPFIDASCRREPDLENKNPSITALCRQELFAPHLIPNDIVVYITVKGRWFKNFDHYRLISILEVIDKKETHNQGKSWYTSRGLTIPSNCMVDDNPPHSFQETGGNYEKRKDIQRFLQYSLEKQKLIGDKKVEKWNEEYLIKSKKWGCFIITKPIFVNLIDPPILTGDTISNIFKRKVNTRNPNIISSIEFKELAKFADINFNQPN
jgi:hypothetical protein